MPITQRARDGSLHNFPNGTSPEAVRHAMTAYDNRSDWGALAGKVGKAIGQTLGRSALSYLDLYGKVRAAPNSAAGLGWGLASAGADAVNGTIPKVRVGDNALQFLNSRLIRKGEAATLGNVQIYSPQHGPDDIMRSGYTGAEVRLGDHEKFHTYQQQRHGSEFLPRWLVQGGQSAENPYELQADAYAVEALKRRRKGR